MKVIKKVAPVFEDFIFNWEYETYILFGGYGSGKSYHVAFKIILKLLEEKRKALVIRDVYATMQDSCYDLIKEILNSMYLLTEDVYEYRKKKNKVLALKSPMKFMFPNGSQIIFKGLDNPEKVKSINGVSIVWIEEASEIKYTAYKELLGRIRTPMVSMHYILSFNPIGKDNWTYRHFFVNLSDEGEETIIADLNKIYDTKIPYIKNNVYYLHSCASDNPWLPWQYVKRLDDMKNYDYALYMVARWGRFGATGTRVLPQFKIAKNPKEFKKVVQRIPLRNHYFGFDFGFEESYNAVISMAVDEKKRILYIYDEVYKNHITDDIMAEEPGMLKIKTMQQKFIDEGNPDLNPIVADNEDPKAIQYYRQQGYYIRACRNKFAGSRISNTRKVKRFTKIVCSPKCKNTIRELKDLTYKKDPKGNIIYDQFNIDPHTFSAIWYALDMCNVADPKEMINNSRKGG